MVIEIEKRQKIYEDFLLGGFSYRDLAKKHDVSLFSVQKIIHENKHAEQELNEIRETRIEACIIQNNTETIQNNTDLRDKSIQLLRQALETSLEMPTKVLVHKKVKNIYVHKDNKKTGEKEKILVRTDEIIDHEEVVAEKVIDYKFKAAERLLSLFTQPNEIAGVASIARVELD